jgi:flagellar hook-associated protein 1
MIVFPARPTLRRAAMSLFGIMQLSSNALNVATLGLHVTSNNLANANTPGYVRQRLIQAEAPTFRKGNLVLGMGVVAVGIQQVADRFLSERLRGAASDLAGSEALADVYNQLEPLINELGEGDLSTQLTSFFGAIHDVLNQPESVSVRNVAVQKAQGLADAFGRLDDVVRRLHESIDQQIASAADDINELVAQIAKLNVQIVDVEGGTVSHSDATALRDERSQALAKLSELIDIRSIEQPTGDVTVYSGGDYLVMLGASRSVEVATTVTDGLQVSQIQIADTDAPVTGGGGRIGGLVAARDTVLRGFLEGLDELAGALIFEFNKIHSGGQGLVGYTDLTSEQSISDPSLTLDAAGLSFTPVNGVFQVQVQSTITGERTTTDIQVDLDGLGTDTDLTTLIAQLDAIDGLSASLTPEGQVRVTSDSPQTMFSFAGDTSGVLAALGLNTFFSGSRASDMGVSDAMKADPRLLAMSSGGVAEDTENGERLAALFTTSLTAHNGLSLEDMYALLIGDVANGANAATAAADGFRDFLEGLEAQVLAVGGVNIDEELVKMLQYQRAYQASAKVIATVNELLQTLLNL